MLQSLKKISWVFLLAFGLQSSWAFSLIGPVTMGDAWQVEDIGFNPINAIDGTSVVDFIDPYSDGPKNIGELYRRNTPVLYYACDANFLDYFDTTGASAVDQAIAIINNSVTNNSLGTLDGYSSALTEFPLNSESVNYQAFAVGLLDLKSETMALMMEQLGLADPVRYTWVLHNRAHAGNIACPVGEYYQVVMRNFDITATTPPLSPPYVNGTSYSPYVNGTLFTYLIEEICQHPPAGPLADASERTADPLAINPPVASLQEEPLFTGAFFTGLTRDDMAGLRYLLTTNNILFESPTPGSVLLSSTQSGGVNYGAPFPLFTSDLTAFVLATQHTDPVTLSNLYPGLIITSSSQSFSVAVTPNVVTYLTNMIGAPVGSLIQVTVTNSFTYTVVTNYVYTFANVVTNTYQPTSTATLVTTNVGPLNGAPINSPLHTNVTSQNITLNVPSGDFYILTNTCGPNLILSNLATIGPLVATNQLILIASNSAGLLFSQSELTYSTTHILLVEPVVCAASGGGTSTNSPGLYEGIGKIQFVKTSFDSLLGQFYQPITNTYSEVVVINSQAVNQTFQRVVTAPDVLFTAQDLLPGPAAANSIEPIFNRTELKFDTNHVGTGLDGPGVINPTSTIIFDKVGPVFYNTQLANLGLSQAILDTFVWGSFDGSTNDPVVYPNSASLSNLVSQVLVQITPVTLPVGTNHVVYPATSFVATGGAFSPPFSWSLVPGSGGLPAGLSLSSGGVISGTPTQTGIFDFTIQLTDSLFRTVTWNYAITIN